MNNLILMRWPRSRVYDIVNVEHPNPYLKVIFYSLTYLFFLFIAQVVFSLETQGNDR